MGRAILAATILIVFVGSAQAGTRADLSGDAVVDFATTMDMPFMNVGNLGNAGELSGAGAGGEGNDRVCGAVDYAYNIGKFAVTAGQYTEFLNAVAATDTYDLYSTSMLSHSDGCRIERSGASASYTYSVASDWADRPVNFISWGDAARFANWLTNGMPTGAQDLTTTENGSYFLNGAIDYAELMAVTRKGPQDWGRYVIPTEDEWYKAAYHANNGVTGDYFDYPTSTDSRPSNSLIDPDPGNNANFYDDSRTIGSPYKRTEAGEFENSASPYGTFDMGGNVWEWNEALIDGGGRALRGGHNDYSHVRMQASYRTYAGNPARGGLRSGFRIAEVPEPATMSMLALGGMALLRRWKRK